MGAGQRLARTSATAPPRPPLIWCSSAVTTQPVSLAAAITASSSRGFTVCTSSTRTETPSPASSSAASMASWTMAPLARIAASFPSRQSRALPISKGVLSSVMTGTASRPKRIKQGPGLSAAARVAFRVSSASQGTMTVIRGRTRVRATSSRDWWVAPSGPTEMPAWAPASLTFRSLQQTVVRIWSQARPARNTQ